MPYSYRSRPQSRKFNNRPARPARQTRSRARKDYIAPERFVKKAVKADAVQYEPKHKFSDFELSQVLHTNLAKIGYEKPSAIQDQTIPLGLQGLDVVGIANTGTGKTAAFSLPLLNRLINEPQSRALIMAPTRELAEQIQEACKQLAKNSGLTGALLIGGVAQGPQLRDLRHNPRVIIGTPGRIKDHFGQGSLKLSEINIVVLDEVDRMLDMGFIKDITFILEQLAKPRQSYFFSATYDYKIRQIVESFSVRPEHVEVKTGETSENVEQNVVYYAGPVDKVSKLHDVLNDEQVDKILIFDDTKRSVERLAQELVARGFKADAIHGGKSQPQRQRALRKFKNNEVKILVATDVAARGIDISDISHVVNYSLPQTYSDYTHRIGRAGRAGRAGNALTFIEG